MKNILVVDDSKDIHALLRVILLRAFRCQITSAHSGHSAIGTILSQKFDLIICDLQMQDGDGCWLLTELQRLGVEVPFIFFTSAPEIAPTAPEGILKAVVSKAQIKTMVFEVRKVFQ